MANVTYDRTERVLVIAGAVWLFASCIVFAVMIRQISKSLEKGRKRKLELELWAESILTDPSQPAELRRQVGELYCPLRPGSPACNEVEVSWWTKEKYAIGAGLIGLTLAAIAVVVWKVNPAIALAMTLIAIFIILFGGQVGKWLFTGDLYDNIEKLRGIAPVEVIVPGGEGAAAARIDKYGVYHA